MTAPDATSPASQAMTAGERAFTAWAGSSKADATPLMWTWEEMPEAQRLRWATIAAAAAPAPIPAVQSGAVAWRLAVIERIKTLWLELNDALAEPPATARILNVLADAKELLAAPSTIQTAGDGVREAVRKHVWEAVLSASVEVPDDFAKRVEMRETITANTVDSILAALSGKEQG